MRLPSSAVVPAATEQRPSQSAHNVGPYAKAASRSCPIWATVKGSSVRAASTFSRSCSVVRIETHEPLICSSVQIAWSNPWNGVSFFFGQHRHAGDFFEDVLLERAGKLPGDLLHGDHADPFCGDVEPLFTRVLVEPGGVLQHDRINDPPSAAASMKRARSRWVEEKPTNFALPELRIASAVSLNSRLFTMFAASSELCSSPSAWMKKKST